jgi:glycosyltransferase involved in cell wall biosynthesis
VEAMGLIGEGVELNLRGRLTESYRSAINALARRHGVATQVVFHPAVDHDDLVRTMEQFDVGLALERPERDIYAQTVTNKMFSYLLAGLAVAATDTPGQREVLEQIPSVGFLYPAGHPQALANGLRRWLSDHHVLRAAQQAAWDAARQRFCWDLEKKEFLHVVEAGLPTSVK